MSLIQSKWRVYTHYQNREQPNHKYGEELEAYIGVIEAYWDKFGNKPGYLEYIMQNVTNVVDPQNPTEQEVQRALEILKDNMMAALLILGDQ